jgi:hypothetical protein
MAEATQVRCPYCNAAQQPRADGQYTCEFCLQPFSVVQARQEESRLIQEIQAWVQQKIGAAGAAAAAGGIDATSRAYIFQQRVLPDIKRDVDRATEAFGTFAQFPLVPMPVLAPGGDASRNPLVEYRGQILGLKNLRARLNSEQVVSFAVGPTEQAVLQSMDRKLAELLHLSNVADAARSRRPDGYAAARRNLEALVEEVVTSLATEAARDPGLGTFLGAIRERYQQLIALARACEDLCASAAVHGSRLADEADAAATALDGVAVAIEQANYAPADTMPVVVGVRAEAAAARTLARWLRCYDTFTGRVPQPFLQFLADLTPMLTGDGAPPEVVAERLEVATTVLRAARGEAVGPVMSSLEWLQLWADGQRTRKTLGLFGSEEQIASLSPFMAPVWVAEVAFSKVQGSVFASGVESKLVAFVDACLPAAAGVVLVEDLNHPCVQALAFSAPLGTNQVALPFSTPSQVTTIIGQAARSRPGVLNPRVTLRGLSFFASGAAHYTSDKASRTLVRCANGFLPIDVSVVQRAQAMQTLTQRYG